MTCQPTSNFSTPRDRKVDSSDKSNVSAHLTALRQLREDRSELIARVKKMVESGELLTPSAARDTARAMLGFE